MMFLLSYNWLKEHVPAIKATPEEVAARLSLHSCSVERVRHLDAGLDGIVVGEIVHIEKHPDADNLHVAAVDIGRTEPMQMIFGKMVVMEVGSKVPVAVAPTTLPDGKRVEKKKLRGVLSEGMLCLDQELGLAQDGVSIRFFDKKVKNGTSVVKALGLHDAILECEITTNRPDMMSVFGLARETAAVFGVKMSDAVPWNERTVSAMRKAAVRLKPLRIRVQDKKLCRRYMGALVEGLPVGASPWEAQARLMTAGIRPINTIVDITNYVMLETGQPMHAFDADKVRGGIVVRRARKGEKLHALDGNTYVLTAEMLIIADDKQPIAIAGVMGGEETGVTSATKRVIFESANFAPVSLRRTARALNLYSESQLRFEKGLSVQSTALAMSEVLTLARKFGGELTAFSDTRVGIYKPPVFAVDLNDIPRFMGVDVSPAVSKKILSSLGFVVKGADRAMRGVAAVRDAGRATRDAGSRVKIIVPWWRDHDIDSSRDFVEEVARVYGYERLPSVLPTGEIPVRPADPTLEFEEKLRDTLAGFGMDGVFTYSFVSAASLTKCNFDPAQALRLLNPLSSDLEYMRPSLLPSLLSIIAENQNNFSEAKIFEVSNVYKPMGPRDLPREEAWCIGAVYGPATDGALFREAKGLCEQALAHMDVTYHFERYAGHDIWHPGRTVSLETDRDHLGMIGELHPDVCERWGINRRVAIFMFCAPAALRARNPVRTYEPLPVFPPVKRDIAFIVPERVEYVHLVDFLRGFDPLIADAELFDVYRGRGVPAHRKSMAFHLTYAAPDRTLTAEEVEQVHILLTRTLKEQFKAEVRE